MVDIDTQRTGGLLELSFPDGSKIVVNTQPPLHEVWLAARAGGFHYRWVAGRWLDTRDGSEFFAALSQHASAQAGKTAAVLTPAEPAAAGARAERSAPEQVEDAPALVVGGRLGQLVLQAHAADAARRARTRRRPSRRRRCTTPSGGVGSCTGTPLSACCMNSIHTGSARPPPVSRSPSLRGLS